MQSLKEAEQDLRGSLNDTRYEIGGIVDDESDKRPDSDVGSGEISAEGDQPDEKPDSGVEPEATPASGDQPDKILKTGGPK